MPVLFYVKEMFFKALLSDAKKIELRIGKQWLNLANKIRNNLPEIAYFKWRNRTIIREIWKIEIYPNIRTALGTGRWKMLGLNAKTYFEAIDEIRKLYPNSKDKVVLFWLRKPKLTKNKNELVSD